MCGRLVMIAKASIAPFLLEPVCKQLMMIATAFLDPVCKVVTCHLSTVRQIGCT